MNDRELIQQYLLGSLDEDDVAALDNRLCADPSLRKAFADQLLLDCNLRDVAGQVRVDAKMPATAGRQRRWIGWAVIASLAAMLLLAVSIQFGGLWNRRDMSTAAVDASIGSIAMLVQSSEDRWKGVSQAPRFLHPGRLQLESGLAEVGIYNGVTLYLEGPVDVELVSLERAHLHAGKMRASVPEEAEGFTVTTDSMRLVDRGTEFAIAADAGGVSKVYVFDGLVDLFPTEETTLQNSARSVREGESVEIGPAFQTRETDLDPDQFPSAAAIDRSVADRFERWKQWSHRFARRSDLVLYFTFEDASDHKPNRKRVENLAVQSRATAHATIVGCETLAGRWPQKKAIGFYNAADRVRVKVPGEYPQLTLACWVRLDELRGVNQALLLTDTFDPWQPHWQIAKEGALKLGISQEDRRDRLQMRVSSSPVEDVASLGRWMHLATVYDSGNRTIQHYINGKEAGNGVLPKSGPLRFGTAEIGNWLKPRTVGGEPIRNLDGRIDELMMLESALDQDEIKEIYKFGH
ncbi:FecR protein [Stieleria maiorica]|uniref:FecR protein n=1 Tax=Stieleria maiorica TaxID=2795974 RepID=A0A5B9MMT9_9BACT|nr:LamG-like jellyroll fold domain-containing protein [Stieleria maiorica]QEG02633.1 FecR protein [Stieleria maiorica]